MLLPVQVVAAKEALREAGDNRFETARLLTEPREMTYTEYYEKMWWALEKRGSGYGDDLWVYRFLDAVFEASTLPKYYYAPASERSELISDIKRLTSKLIKIYSQNSLNPQLIASKNPSGNGFCFYEEWDYTNYPIIEDMMIHRLPTISFLKMAEEYAECEIERAQTHGYSGKNVRERRFIRCLASKHKKLFGSQLNDVITTAVFAVYGTRYEADYVSNLLNRKKVVSEN